MPCSGPRSRPDASNASADRASAMARSAVTRLKALSEPFSASMRSIKCAVNPVGVTSPDRNIAASPVIDR